MIILVVDNAEDTRMLFKSILESGDYRDILLSDSAEGALKLLDRGDIKVDLILLDVLMPGMDGIELCRKLKSTEESKYIQVIIERVELLASMLSAMRLKKETDASRSYEVELDRAPKEIESFYKEHANEKE